MTSPILESKSKYKALLAFIIVAWFVYTLYTMPVYVQLTCMKYPNDSGYCNLDKYKVLSLDKTNFTSNDLFGAEFIRDKDNSQSSPDLYLNTSKGKVLFLPNYFISSDEAVKFRSQVNIFVKSNGPLYLKIQKDAVLLSIFSLILVVALIYYTFNGYFFQKKVK